MSKRSKPMKNYLAPGEVAEMLMVSPATVRYWATQGILKSVSTPGGHRRFTRHEIERLARDKNLTLQQPDDGTLRVLIVDDDTHVAAYLSNFFHNLKAGILTKEAHDGYAAGRQVQVFRPHVVLLDLMMPGLNGFEVCKQIKSDAITRATRVIAMTGYYNSENVARALEAGAECCIEKPFDQNQLVTLLGLDEAYAKPTASEPETLRRSG